MPNSYYILHKNGANSHYQGLAYLLHQHGKELKYREFSVFGMLIKSVLKLQPQVFSKQLINLAFLIKLLFTSNKNVIVGIAPFDPKLKLLLFILKKHHVFYHTSWANWDGSFMPKSKKVTPEIKQKWRFFLEELSLHIFTVTADSKKQLLANYNLNASKLSVVKHACNLEKFKFTSETNIPDHSFIYVGRLREEKGIKDLLVWFSRNTHAQITFVGKGELENTVAEYAATYPNISYTGFVKDQKEINKLFNRHNFVILNSYRTNKWEELFGMVLIEGMTCGLIPVASDHVGPKSIISSDFGYLFKEGEVADMLNELTANKVQTEKKYIAVNEASVYATVEIAKLWKPILQY